MRLHPGVPGVASPVVFPNLVQPWPPMMSPEESHCLQGRCLLLSSVGTVAARLKPGPAVALLVFCKCCYPSKPQFPACKMEIATGRWAEGHHVAQHSAPRMAFRSSLSSGFPCGLKEVTWALWVWKWQVLPPLHFLTSAGHSRPRTM